MSGLNLFIILLLLPMHASIAARPLDVISTEILLSIKDVEKSSVHVASSSSWKVKPKTEKTATRGLDAKDDRSANWDVMKTVEIKEVMASSSVESSNRKILGNNIRTISFGPRAGMQEASHKLDFKGVARRTLESTSHQEGETTREFDEPVEDVVVMDYAHPHKKPPIHNRTP